MNRASIPFGLLSLFAADRQVYRAFGHLIAARMGTLLLVPDNLVVGEPGGVVLEGCPVPHEEVYAVLEYKSSHQVDPFAGHAWNDMLQQIEYLGINAIDCEMDYISPMVRGEEKVLRLTHPSGVRYAAVA